jgi:ParB family chromosome partitioning protein
MSTQQKNKPRLGRGLSSLISISELPIEAEVPPKTASTAVAQSLAATPSQSASPTELPIAQIQPNPHQPRRSFNDSSLSELAASIKSTGLIQPILVRKVGQQYQLIAGERRLRAAKLAGLAAIPALVRDIDTVTQAQMALIENIQREDLNPIDRAQGYRTLIEQLGLTQAELAGRLGEDRSSIANFLRLLDLSDSIKAMVRDGRLSVGHAKLIAGITDAVEQERLANLVILQGLSVRNLERAIKEGPRPEARKPAPSGPTAHLQDLEKNISRQLGLRVQLRAAAKKGKGRLVIHYASLDQFDELLTRLKVSAE